MLFKMTLRFFLCLILVQDKYILCDPTPDENKLQKISKSFDSQKKFGIFNLIFRVQSRIEKQEFKKLFVFFMKSCCY